MLTLYEKYPLAKSTKQIRVLDILPASTSVGDANDDPLASHVRVIDLDSKQSFTALSYVWGVPTANRPQILCDGFKIQVTHNCYSALKHLRSKLGSFTIWVDALCIKQEDIEEKSCQLPLMGEIYTKAASVFIWLGEGTESAEKAMGYLASAGLPEFYTTSNENSRSRHVAAAWSMYTASWSRTRHPVPFKGEQNSFRIPLLCSNHSYCGVMVSILILYRAGFSDNPVNGLD
jgi:hypothetical protein